VEDVFILVTGLIFKLYQGHSAVIRSYGGKPVRVGSILGPCILDCGIRCTRLRLPVSPGLRVSHDSAKDLAALC
jgi:hypothetical protein